MTRYLIPTILLALIAALFLSFRPQTSNSHELQAPGHRQSPHAGTEPATPETSVGNPPRTKSKIRIHHPKPTIEETVELLQNTIIPKVDFQDQSLSEVTAALNTFINDAGIPPHKLKVVINNPELFAQWRIREFRIREAPLAVILKYVCDSTILRYRIEPGIIRFILATEELPQIENPNASPDSFEFLPGQMDPFAEPNSSTQEADPFAEPKVPTSP